MLELGLIVYHHTYGYGSVTAINNAKCVCDLSYTHVKLLHLVETAGTAMADIWLAFVFGDYSRI